MNEISLSYLNEVASQVIFISAFLTGFAATIMGTFVASKTDNKLSSVMILGAATATCFFIITVFLMTNSLMHTTPGYPGKIDRAELKQQNILGMLTFLIGIVSFLFIISLSGWFKSKSLGIATTILAVGTLGVILVVLS